jgi:hypothetical protein
MSEYYSRSGEPIDQARWLREWEGDNKRVAQTSVDEANVSTVYLGLNHRFGDGPPLIFETMIFGGEHSESQWRYSSEEAAVAGHERVVKALQDGRDPDA